MSNYTKITDFTAKDNLPVGDPDKKVRGQLFQDEFDSIATAIETKVESNQIVDPVQPQNRRISAGFSTIPDIDLTQFDNDTYEPLTSGTEFDTFIDPTFVTSRLHITYSFNFKFVSSVSTPTAGSQGAVYGFGFEIINNETNQTFNLDQVGFTAGRMGISNLILAGRQVNAPPEDSFLSRHNFEETVVCVTTTEDSIGNILGSSNSGYTVRLTGKQFSLFLGSAFVRSGVTKVVEEVI